MQKTEGIIPAPETSLPIRSVIDEAIRYRESTEEKNPPTFLLCCHGHFDTKTFEDYLPPYEYPKREDRGID